MAEPKPKRKPKPAPKAPMNDTTKWSTVAAVVVVLGIVFWAFARGASGRDQTSGDTPNGDPAAPSQPAPSTSVAIDPNALPAPLEDVCELGVVTGATTDAVTDALEDDALLTLLSARTCGESCEAVKTFVRDPMGADHQLDVEIVTTEDWPLPPKDTWSTVAPGLGKDDLRALSAMTTIAMVHARQRLANGGARTHVAYRTCTALAAALSEKLHGYVYDEVVRRIETPSDFAKHVVTNKPSEPAFRPDHIVIQSYLLKDGSGRMITLGMSRFGAPDIEARGFDPNAEGRVAYLVNGVAEAMASGRFTPPFAIAGASVPVVQELEHNDGDPDGDIVALTPPGGTTKDGWNALLATLQGAGVALSLDRDLPELVALAKKVRARMPEIAKHARDHLHLKADFPADGGSEAMWIAVTSCDATTCTGTLENKPVAALSLSIGQSVTVPFDRVHDYMLTLPDGGIEGGESTRIIEKTRTK